MSPARGPKQCGGSSLAGNNVGSLFQNISIFDYICIQISTISVGDCARFPQDPFTQGAFQLTGSPDKDPLQELTSSPHKIRAGSLGRTHKTTTQGSKTSQGQAVPISHPLHVRVDLKSRKLLCKQQVTRAHTHTPLHTCIFLTRPCDKRGNSLQQKVPPMSMFSMIIFILGRLYLHLHTCAGSFLTVTHACRCLFSENEGPRWAFCLNIRPWQLHWVVKPSQRTTQNCQQPSPSPSRESQEVESSLTLVVLLDLVSCPATSGTVISYHSAYILNKQMNK